MVGMLTVFTLIGNSLQESGFRAALVNVKNIRHEDYNAVFWCSLLIGTCTYLFLFFCAPLIARFYQEPELTPLARYCFLAIPIASLGTAQGAYLFRNLKVRQQALSGIIAHIVSGCLGITLAFCGFSYWGIATQSLTYLVTVTLCTWYFSPWRPTFHIDFRPLKSLFAFSSKLLITNIANQLNNNLLSVILGKYFTPQAVGNYNQANKWGKQMERYGASVHYRNDGRRGTARIGKHQRRPRTLSACVPQNSPLLCFPCLSRHVRAKYCDT